MQISHPTEHRPRAQHLLLRHPGRHAAVKDAAGLAGALGQTELFIRQEGLLPGLPGQDHGIDPLQHLHILRHGSGTIQLRLLRHHGLDHQPHLTPEHQLPGGQAPGVRTADHRFCPDDPVFPLMAVVQPDPEGHPAFQPPGTGPVLRVIQHPDHHPAVDADVALPPLLPPQDGLSPGGDDPPHVGHTLRQTDLLALLPCHRGVELLLPEPLHPLLKWQFHFRLLLVQNTRLYSAGSQICHLPAQKAHPATDRPGPHEEDQKLRPHQQSRKHPRPKAQKPCGTDLIFPTHKKPPRTFYAGWQTIFTSYAGRSATIQGHGQAPAPGAASPPAP